MGYYFLAMLAILPFTQAANTIYGYPAYDAAKYQCKVVHGGFTEWSYFGPCSVSCGTGYQARYRHCAAPVAKYGGNPCKGNKVEAKKCKTKLKCPVDGGWSKEIKGKCSKRCGGGKVTYKRFCNNPRPSKPCGKDCIGKDTRTEKCNTHRCPEWGPWKCNACFKKKGKCQKYCSRACRYYRKNHYCTGKKSEFRSCPYKDCFKKPDFPVGPCRTCKEDADKLVSSGKKPAGFPGHNCRATHLKGFCDDNKAKQSQNKNLPANNWFFVQCSNNGPWCMACATRNVKYNSQKDACV